MLHDSSSCILVQGFHGTYTHAAIIVTLYTLCSLVTLFSALMPATKFGNCVTAHLQAETVMDERQRRHAALEAALREVITQILLIVNEKKDHIPPVLQPDVVISFPFEISIPRYKMDCRNTSCGCGVFHFNLSFSVSSFYPLN